MSTWTLELTLDWEFEKGLLQQNTVP
jgi:hypothetical protein